MKAIAPLLLVAALAFLPSWSHADNRLVIHEWGTFTSLEDESGNPIGGINTDDEPVPDFVHDLSNLIHGPSEMPAIFFKGVPRCDRDVLVRLETPVIYFHLPPSIDSLKLDIDVTFHGGWLTQFYPAAQAAAPDMSSPKFDVGALTSRVDGSLTWKNLTVGGNPQLKSTDSKVWLAPRAVDAAAVTAPGGESERFLFYRGVGHLAAPVRVVRHEDELQISSDLSEPIHGLWLVDVRGDGTCAVRELPRAGATTAATFAEKDFNAANLGVIRQSLRSAMMHEGLYGDEAEGLLNTWEASYFRRPGLRLFFLVPASWTDRVLPLHASVAADVLRVMIGRIEIVTPHQRQLLAAIAHGPVSSPGNWLDAALLQRAGGHENFYREQWFQSLLDGHDTFAQAKVNVPADFGAYLQLGRFRNALILDEMDRRPSETLKTFIANYALQPADTPPPSVSLAR
jgi:hypothetical protein